MVSKTHLLLLLIIHCCLLISQNPLDRYYSEAPNGKSQIRYPDGSYVELTKVDGHLHGAFYEYYNNGQLRCKAKLEHGKYIDTAFSYHKKGQVKTIDIFKHDTILYSQWDWYNDNGTLADSDRFYMFDLGVDISTRKHGKLTRDAFLVYDIISDRRIDFKNLQGCRYIHLAFYQDGSQCSKSEKFSDQKDGEQLLYFKNGNIKTKEYYITSKRHGKQYYYDTEGKVTVKCYDNGRKKSCDVY